jgi:hypothetical protein
MILTDSFTWDGAPDKDSHTENISQASLIPVIKNTVWKLCVFIVGFHGCYFIMQVAEGRRILSINSYYPFDWTVTPLYELINISQVRNDYCYGVVSYKASHPLRVFSDLL